MKRAFVLLMVLLILCVLSSIALYQLNVLHLSRQEIELRKVRLLERVRVFNERTR
ncbi:MAG: hypothetical protein AABZ14_04965 [Candidatus Margulisiibacteriota bacterium]